MKRAAAVRTIKACARDRSLVFTEHAYDKMDKLAETEESVSLAIAAARSFDEQADGTWRVGGGGLTCVVAIRGDVIVVTLFLG